MELRLAQRDHPRLGVNELGLSHRDPYFQACWRPILNPWTAHVVSHVAALTNGGDRTISFDQLCRQLNPTPAHPNSAAKDVEIRAKTVFGAMDYAQRSGLGFVEWQATHRATFAVYRHVPLLNEPDLRRLTDPELFAHAGTVQDLNRRLSAAGRPSLPIPPWLTDRLGRSDPTARPADPTLVQTAQARLEALRRSQMPTPPGVSL